MPNTLRRRILQTAGALGLSTGAASARGTSGDGDEDEDDCGSCPSDDYCPLDNSSEIRTQYGAEDEAVHYHIRVTGELELPSGERVQTTKGSLDGHRSRERSCTFKYSGELACLRVTGRGSAHLHQDEPCDN